MAVIKYKQDGAWHAIKVQAMNGKSAYQIWLDQGGEGSEADFLESLKGAPGEKGADGAMTFEELTPEQVKSLKGEKGDPGAPGQNVKIVNSKRDEQGNTVLTVTDGAKTEDLVIQRGPAGPKGADGVMTFADLTPEQKAGLKGDRGEKGDPGEPGKDGTSVEVINIDHDDKNLVTNVNLKDANGYHPFEIPDGEPGPPGPKGESAYAAWLSKGNSGTTADFLESLKGEKGEPGAPGKDGKDGRNGTDGKDGRSLQIISQTKNADGSISLVISDNNPAGASYTEVKIPPGPKGEPGANGKDGRDGAQGPPGKDGVNATTTSTATQSKNGLMSSSDKRVLDTLQVSMSNKLDKSTASSTYATKKDADAAYDALTYRIKQLESSIADVKARLTDDNSNYLVGMVRDNQNDLTYFSGRNSRGGYWYVDFDGLHYKDSETPVWREISFN